MKIVRAQTEPVILATAMRSLALDELDFPSLVRDEIGKIQAALALSQDN